VEDVTVLWNQAVHKDRKLTANRPDITIKNKKEKTCTLIDVVVKGFWLSFWALEKRILLYLWGMNPLA
jgi:hypothetical protein